MSIYYSSCQTEYGKLYYLYICIKSHILLEKRLQLCLYLDDGLELNCIVLITFRVVTNASVINNQEKQPFSSFEFLKKGFIVKFTFISEEREIENGPITWGQNISKQYWFAKIQSGRVLSAEDNLNKPIRAQPQVTCVPKVNRPNRHTLFQRPAHTQTK